MALQLLDSLILDLESQLGLQPGQNLQLGGPAQERGLEEESKTERDQPANENGESTSSKKKKKKSKQPQEKKSGGVNSDDQPMITRLDIRVGRIVEVRIVSLLLYSSFQMTM